MLDRRAFLASILVLASLSGGCATAPQGRPETQPAAAPQPIAVTLLQINDVYEIGPVEGGKSGGLARVATIRKRLLAENPNTFTLLAGDFLSPSALGTAQVDGKALAGQQMVAVLNALGLDLVTFGNHEFDLKEDQLLARLSESRFRWISANVSRASGGPFPGVAPNAVLTVQTPDGAVSLGVIGVTLTENEAPYVAYADPIDSFSRQYQALSGKVDAVVGLTHLDFAEDQELAEAIPEIDLILGGHEHENMRALRGPDFTPIVKADANVRTVYVHRLTWEPTSRKLAVASEMVMVNDSIPNDPEVARVVKEWEDKGFAGFRAQGFEPTETVAETTVPLDGHEASVRNGSTNLTDLLARAFLAEAKGAELAIYNSGSIRIDDVIPPGDVTQYDVLRILPFGGKVQTADIQGSLLAQALDGGLASRGSGGFLQTANVARANNAWTVGGQPLDPNRTYRIAITDYLAAGRQSNLEFLKPGPGFTIVQDNRDQRMALIDQLRREYPATGAAPGDGMGMGTGTAGTGTAGTGTGTE